MNDLVLEHYADGEVALSRDRGYEQPPLSTYAKPRGFWVSVKGEDDWPSWCESERFGIGRLAVRHEVRLRPAAEVLVLTTADGLDLFTRTYGVFTRKSYAGHSWTDVSIDWALVTSQYDGLIIAPYQWDRRMDLDWYYGWDVASGCIWNLEAIESVEAVAWLMTEAAE